MMKYLLVLLFSFSILAKQPAPMITASGTDSGSGIGDFQMSSCSYSITYFRVGNYVHAFGGLVVTPTVASRSDCRIPLPIASNFTSTDDAGGIASRQTSTQDGICVGFADTTNDEFKVNCKTSNTSTNSMRLIYSYVVK